VSKRKSVVSIHKSGSFTNHVEIRKTTDKSTSDKEVSLLGEETIEPLPIRIKSRLSLKIIHGENNQAFKTTTLPEQH
jgi:hypothetical protein